MYLTLQERCKREKKLQGYRLRNEFVLRRLSNTTADVAVLDTRDIFPGWSIVSASSDPTFVSWTRCGVIRHKAPWP